MALAQRYIGSTLLVILDIEEYYANGGSTMTSQTLRFSDNKASLNVFGQPFVGTGQLLNITPSASQLKPSGGEITLSLSGIPDTALKEMEKSKLKGSRVQIWRALLDPTYGHNSLLGGVTNPVGRFFGLVTNVSLDEDYDNEAGLSINTVNLICSSWVDLLSAKEAGRKTNPSDMKLFYPTDNSFDRVPPLVNANFNFGVPE